MDDVSNQMLIALRRLEVADTRHYDVRHPWRHTPLQSLKALGRRGLAQSRLGSFQISREGRAFLGGFRSAATLHPGVLELVVRKLRDG